MHLLVSRLTYLRKQPLGILTLLFKSHSFWPFQLTLSFHAVFIFPSAVVLFHIYAIDSRYCIIRLVHTNSDDSLIYSPLPFQGLSSAMTLFYCSPVFTDL
jgi:hypothetical protein